MYDYLPTPTVLVYYGVPSGEMPGTLGCIVLFCKSECDSKNETKKKKLTTVKPQIVLNRGSSIFHWCSRKIMKTNHKEETSDSHLRKI